MARSGGRCVGGKEVNQGGGFQIGRLMNNGQVIGVKQVVIKKDVLHISS